MIYVGKAYMMGRPMQSQKFLINTTGNREAARKKIMDYIAVMKGISADRLAKIGLTVTTLDQFIATVPPGLRAIAPSLKSFMEKEWPVGTVYDATGDPERDTRPWST